MSVYWINTILLELPSIYLCGLINLLFLHYGKYWFTFSKKQTSVTDEASFTLS